MISQPTKTTSISRLALSVASSVATVLVLCGQAAGSLPNLLVNGSFEDPTQATGGIGGWRLFNNAFYTGAEVAPQDGSLSLKAYGPFHGFIDASGAYQNVPAAPGQRFLGSAWAHAPSGDPIKGRNNLILLSLQFCDADNMIVGKVGSSPGTNQVDTVLYDGLDPSIVQDQWRQSFVTSTAPAGTAYVRLNFFFIQFSGQPGAVFFDNATLSQVPEPSAGSLLASVGCVLGAAQRRRFGRAR